MGLLMNAEQLMECELSGKIKVLRENLPPCPQKIYDLTLDQNLANAVEAGLTCEV
jgi:hypothetical protein